MRYGWCVIVTLLYFTLGVAQESRAVAVAVAVAHLCVRCVIHTAAIFDCVCAYVAPMPVTYARAQFVS